MENHHIYQTFVDMLPPHVKEGIVSLSYEEIAMMSLSELGATSLQSIEIVMNLEDSFHMDFSEAHLLQFNLLKVQHIIEILSSTKSS